MVDAEGSGKLLAPGPQTDQAGTSDQQILSRPEPGPKPKPRPKPSRENGVTHEFKTAKTLVHQSAIEFVFTPSKQGMYSIRATGTWKSDYSTNPDDHVVLMVCDLKDPTKKCTELESSRLGTHTDSPHHSMRLAQPVRIVLANPHQFDMSISDVKMHVKQIG